MSTIAELEDKVKELMDEIETLKRENKNEEFEYPFEENEPYEVIIEDGRIVTSCWTNHNMDCERYEQGNVFKTRDEAIRERDKREILMRFNQFRDKCNGDWKPDWEDKSEDKFFILFNHESSELKSNWCSYSQPFSSFGFFKNIEDANRAIELFGDEIKRLWVDE